MRYRMSDLGDRRTRLEDERRRIQQLRRLPEPSPASGDRARRVVDVLVGAAVVISVLAGLVLWLAEALPR
jgi:hypothetical protein